MSQKSLVILDFDGTIADTAVVAFEVINEVLIEYKEQPITQAEFQKLRGLSGTEVLKHFKLGIFKLPRVITSVKRRLQLKIDDIQLIDGMAELIRGISALDNTKLVVLSSNRSANIEHFLKKHKLYVDFDEIVGDASLFNKSRLFKKIADNNRQYRQVIGVGDEHRDIEAANKTGVISVAVSWGLNTKTKLKEANPDFLVSDVVGLNNVLSKLIGQTIK